MKKKQILYFVIPVYNENEILNNIINKLEIKLNELISNKIISEKSLILFVDDGSTDDSWNIINNCKNKYVKGISLSRNFGQQNALLAGYLYAKDYADVVISMDADLQDDISAVDKMIDEYYNGNDIVYGVRSSRKNDNVFKRCSANLFYKIMNLMGIETINNHADYRLVSKKVLDVLNTYSEVNLFLRGIFPIIGFNSSIVYYERLKRIGGKSKYTLKKMISFAWDGITSFSIKPLKFISFVGSFILIISFVIMIYTIIQKCNGNTVPGWAFLNISIWFIGGVQMLSLGIIGEYIGKIYKETKSRPRYIIKDIKK